jgi:hypothetical protein
MSADDDFPPLPDEPKPGFYRHYKGGDYEVVEVARHSETLEPLVVYRALYGARGLWVRPAGMWNELVIVAGQAVRRFTRIIDEI